MPSLQHFSHGPLHTLSRCHSKGTLTRLVEGKPETNMIRLLVIRCLSLCIVCPDIHVDNTRVAQPAPSRGEEKFRRLVLESSPACPELHFASLCRRRNVFCQANLMATISRARMENANHGTANEVTCNLLRLDIATTTDPGLLLYSGYRFCRCRYEA